ncbi:MAG: hypothetical protein V2I97_06585 [Desulfococcaceae bacterium]|jgi:hypothetical protein|nr:hypothetical protein [Desulfococcaceae bacterium]
MKTVIQKADLDTCLTGLILEVKESDNIIVSKGEACADDLENPDVCCIEAGGSGLVHLNNFDHHNCGIYLPPACRQAFESCGKTDPELKRLTSYVCIVDEALRLENPIPFPSLSNLFSGMLFTESDARQQFFKGMAMLRTVLDEKRSPFRTMPDLEEWKIYRRAKEEHIRKLREISGLGDFYISESGLRLGFAETGLIMSGKGFLYEHNCDAVILHNPAFGIPPISKYTIVSKEIPLDGLKKIFDSIEIGWGGRDTILGSPRKGTLLDKKQVLEIVLKNLEN